MSVFAVKRNPSKPAHKYPDAAQGSSPELKAELQHTPKYPAPFLGHILR